VWVVLQSGKCVHYSKVAQIDYSEYTKFKTYVFLKIQCLGVGVAMFIVSCCVAIYYNVVIAWSVFYVVNSLRSDVPWKSCNPDWSTTSILDFL